MKQALIYSFKVCIISMTLSPIIFLYCYVTLPGFKNDNLTWFRTLTIGSPYIIAFSIILFLLIVFTVWLMHRYYWNGIVIKVILSAVLLLAGLFAARAFKRVFILLNYPRLPHGAINYAWLTHDYVLGMYSIAIDCFFFALSTVIVLWFYSLKSNIVIDEASAGL